MNASVIPLSGVRPGNLKAMVAKSNFNRFIYRDAEVEICHPHANVTEAEFSMAEVKKDWFEGLPDMPGIGETKRIRKLSETVYPYREYLDDSSVDDMRRKHYSAIHYLRTKSGRGWLLDKFIPRMPVEPSVLQ